MPSPWIRAHASPLDLKVVRRASGALHIHLAQAAGHLWALWGWLSKKSDTGDLSPFTDAELEDAAGWTGQPGAFARFVRERHTDAKGRVRDWDEYMGPMVRARELSKLRMRNHRKKLRDQQDADADAGFGGANGGPESYPQSFPHDVDNPNGPDVTRNGARPRVTRNTPDVRTNIPDVRPNFLTREELRKSIRTTGMYLGAELDLSTNPSNDEKPLSRSSSAGHNQKPVGRDGRDGLHGVELVRAFARRFYADDPAAMLDALRRLRAVLRPRGVEFEGRTVTATPRLVVRAMNETLASPPDKDGAAVVFVLKKLSGGRLHEVTTDKGVLVTEAMASEGRAVGRDATRALVALAPEMVASIGRPMPGRTVRSRDDELRRLFSGACPALPSPS